MQVFNSLGSNYNFRFAFQALLAGNNKKYSEKLKNFLDDKYQGKSILVYKGREALRLALRIISLKDSTVAICGFTCFAVYDAVVKEGYKVEYLDIEKNDLNFSFETLEKHVKKNPLIKIVIVQNTLGNPCGIEKIEKFCKEKKIILIEDLAHSIGTIYEGGKESGSFGDFVTLSFSQDKVVDGISGGALVIRNHEYFQFGGRAGIMNQGFDQMKLNKQIIDKLYPLFTFLIRKTYESGFGKILHVFLKSFKLLSNPMSESDDIRALPSWYCKLVFDEFSKSDKNLNHRKKIAKIYFEKLNKSILGINSNISHSTNIRFPILVENRRELISLLKNNGIFVSDIWYDAPIAPKKYFPKTSYNNECPNSEFVSTMILNLPTHVNVSEKDAEYISRKINQWIIS